MQNITKRKIRKLIPILILLAISILVIINLTTTDKNKKTEIIPEVNINTEQNLQTQENTQTEKIPDQKNLATLEINSTKYTTEISENISIYDFMNKLREEKKIDFKEKTYTAMGAFVEEINNIKNTGEQNWIYYVNNQKANIGISNYQIKPGDVVSWKYESQ
jgi:hypothetical protein